MPDLNSRGRRTQRRAAERSQRSRTVMDVPETVRALTPTDQRRETP